MRLPLLLLDIALICIAGKPTMRGFWHGVVTQPEYAVELDPEAIERALWEKLPNTIYRDPRRPAWEMAHNYEEYIRNRIDSFAEKPLTDAGIRKWLNSPYFSTYCPLSVDSRRCGAYFIDHDPLVKTPLDVVREMSLELVRPPRRWKQVRAAIRAVPDEE